MADKQWPQCRGNVGKDSCKEDFNNVAAVNVHNLTIIIMCMEIVES